MVTMLATRRRTGQHCRQPPGFGPALGPFRVEQKPTFVSTHTYLILFVYVASGP
jgi:hypothetical protein